jgi:hypothetical protein
LLAQTILREKEGAGVLERAVLLPPGQLDRSAATKLAREFLERYGADHTIINFLMGVDEMEVRASLYQHFTQTESIPSGRMQGLTRYVRAISELGPPKGPIARVLSINGNALLSYREGNTISEVILGGSDPTRFKIEDVEFQLIHLSFSKGTSAVADDVRYSLRFYFRAAPRISIHCTIAATRRMESLLKIKNVGVLVRSDPWFHEYDDYPAYPAFVRDLPPPSLSQYEFSAYTSCSVGFRQGLSCSGRNFEP